MTSDDDDDDDDNDEFFSLVPWLTQQRTNSAPPRSVVGKQHRAAEAPRFQQRSRHPPVANSMGSQMRSNPGNMVQKEWGGFYHFHFIVEIPRGITIYILIICQYIKLLVKGVKDIKEIWESIHKKIT